MMLLLTSKIMIKTNIEIFQLKLFFLENQNVFLYFYKVL